MLPIGGQNVTNDIAAVLKTSLQTAEDLKINEGTADLQVSEDEEISVSVLGEDAGRTVSRFEVCQVIEARMRETFELLRNEIRAAGVRQLPAGVILTGELRSCRASPSSVARCSRCRSGVAAPTGIGGLVDTLLTPAYSTSVGLLHWGATTLVDGEPMRYESAPAMGGLGRIRDALRSIFP